MSNALLRLVVLVTFAIVLLHAPGCGRHYRVDPILRTDRDAPGTWRTKSPIGNGEHEYLNPLTYNPDGHAQSLYQRATGTGEAARSARNRLQNAIIALSVRGVSGHLAQLKAAENNVNLVLGAATLALSGAASVSPTMMSQSLAAAASGTEGARGLVNEQVLRDALGESIIGAIYADRTHFLDSVILPRQKLSVTDYDVDAALRDAVIYHDKGSFYHGLRQARRAIELHNARLESAADVGDE